MLIFCKHNILVKSTIFLLTRHQKHVSVIIVKVTIKKFRTGGTEKGKCKKEETRYE